MKDHDKSKEQLIDELKKYRSSMAEFKRDIKTGNGGEILPDETGLEYEGSRDFFHAIIKNFPIPVYVKDEEHHWLLVNDQICELLGMSREALTGKSDTEFFSKEEKDLFFLKDEEIIKPGRVLNREDEIILNNQLRVFNTIKTLYKDPVTGKKYIIGIIRDISKEKKKNQAAGENRKNSESRFTDRTMELIEANRKLQDEIFERRRAQDMLNETSERYRRLVELSPEAVVVHREGKVLYINQAGLNLFGFSSFVEAIGKNIIEFVHPDYREIVIQRIRKTNEEKKIGALIEEKMIRLNGEIIDVEVTNAPIIYFGAPAVLVIIIDITEKKKLHEELLKAHKLESLGVLAGGIAHDFNNLLTSIMGYISMVKTMTHPDEKEFIVLTKAENASLRAKELTQQLLTFSKGGGPIKTIRSIPEIIRGCINIVPKKETVRIEFDPPSDIWPVEVDEGQIFQVFNNLILNAQQSIVQSGEIIIQVKNVLVDEDSQVPIPNGKYILISISDTGMGIPYENINKIFDPYFTTKSQGDGLGLAIAYSVVKKHDGYINVKSEVNQGTSFLIYLPATEKEQVLLHKPVIELRRGTGKVLILDDEKDVREVAQDILIELGYTAETAENNAECLKLYQEALIKGEPFNIVLVDLILAHGMNGKDTIQQLQQLDPDVKAIVTSGYSNDMVMSNFKDYGFKGAIAKPYKMLELSHVIYEVLHPDNLS